MISEIGNSVFKILIWDFNFGLGIYGIGNILILWAEIFLTRIRDFRPGASIFKDWEKGFSIGNVGFIFE